MGNDADEIIGLLTSMSDDTLWLMVVMGVRELDARKHSKVLPSKK